MSNFFDVAHAHGKAANRSSAMAVSGGESYSPSHRGHEDFDLPPPYFLRDELGDAFASSLDVYGRKYFRLTVLGLAKENDRSKRRYVCKCSCGMYCLRTTKSLNKNKFASCGVCLENHERILKEHYRKTGVDLDSAIVWARMGGA